MYLGADGKIDRSLTAPAISRRACPGTVRGLAHGAREVRQAAVEGRRHARRTASPSTGFTISANLARGLNRELSGRMAKFPASVAAYGKPGGGEWAAGDRLVLTDLGKTLRAIATDGPDAFYKGWIADAIADDMKANGGLITKEDLAAYEAKERDAASRHATRDSRSSRCRRSSSGGVALIEMLNILEPFDLKSKGLLTAPALHLQIEAMRRAYLDRARHLGDPDFVDVPVETPDVEGPRARASPRRSIPPRPRAASSWARTSSP